MRNKIYENLEKDNYANIDNGMTYENIALLDLRHLNSLEEIKKIRLIKNVAVIMFNSEATDDVKSALSTIPMRNTSSVVYLEPDYSTCVCSGNSTLTTEQLYNKKSLLVINGRGVVLPDETVVGEINVQPKVIMNGEIFINDDMCKLIDIIVMNGVIKRGDFTSFVELINCNFSKVVYDEIKPNTLICLTDKITFTEEITVSMLKEKNLSFTQRYAKIKASKAVKEYIDIRMK